MTATVLDQLLDEVGWAGTVDDGTLASWLSGPAGLLQSIYDLCGDTPQGPGWSQIVDVTRAPTDALPWLAQFVGVRLPASLPDAQARAAVVAETGWHRGTATSLVAAAQAFLTTGTVTIAERTPDPYSFTVLIPAAGLAGTYAALDSGFSSYTALDASQSTYAGLTSTGGSAGVQAALEALKPAGLLMTVTYT